MATPGTGMAQDEGATALAREAATLDRGSDGSIETLRRVRTLLDRIVAEHPSSDLAVEVLLEGTIEGLDVAALEARLAAAATAGEAAAPVASPTGASASDAAARACLARGVGMPGAPLDLVADVGSDGSVVGPPRLPDGRGPAAAGGATHDALVAALDACAPFPSNPGGRTLRITVDGSGAIALATAGEEVADYLPEQDVAPPPVEAPLASTSDASSPAAPPAPEPPRPPAGDAASEASIGLDRLEIRDLQARLLVSGHDPNGVDGSIGPGTQGALRSWQTSQGIEPSGYLTGDQLASLRTASQTALDIWLRDPANAARREPPPPIALTPRRMTGTWSFTTRCGAGSRLGRVTIDGAMAVAHAGGSSYRGRVQNSQGLRGNFSGTLRGRTLVGEIDWGLLIGRTRFDGRVADGSLTIGGRDTNGCSFSATKR